MNAPQQEYCITCETPLAGTTTATCHRCGCAFHQVNTDEGKPACGVLYGVEDMMTFIFLCRRCHEYMVRYRTGA